MATNNGYKAALLWHGDRSAREAASFDGNRFQGVVEALGAVGIEAVPCVYNDDFASEVHQQLLAMDGVLVWVNPIEQGRNRAVLDAVLRKVSDSGVFVSTHPDTIARMGTKDVLFRTRKMSWGTDTHLYATLEELRRELPLRLAENKPRVLKQYRGNGGNGVWKVERHPQDSGMVRVRHALRGSLEQEMRFEQFLVQCADYFTGGGRLIDQAYQERLAEGMVRCYLVQDTVAGFGHQAINALYPAPAGAPVSEAPQPGPRLYHPPTNPEFQGIKAKMETEWLPDLCKTLDIPPDALPMLWDADLLLGPKTVEGEDTYVLCEINVSAVSPFPDAALEPLAQAMKAKLLARRA